MSLRESSVNISEDQPPPLANDASMLTITKCALCEKMAVRPVILSCGDHNVCLACAKAADTNKTKTRCPRCRAKFTSWGNFAPSTMLQEIILLQMNGDVEYQERYGAAFVTTDQALAALKPFLTEAGFKSLSIPTATKILMAKTAASKLEARSLIMELIKDRRLAFDGAAFGHTPSHKTHIVYLPEDEFEVVTRRLKASFPHRTTATGRIVHWAVAVAMARRNAQKAAAAREGRSGAVIFQADPLLNAVLDIISEKGLNEPDSMLCAYSNQSANEMEKNNRSHCEHCPGREGQCACTNGCVRDGVGCHPRFSAPAGTGLWSSLSELSSLFDRMGTAIGSKECRCSICRTAS